MSIMSSLRPMNVIVTGPRLRVGCRGSSARGAGASRAAGAGGTMASMRSAEPMSMPSGMGPQISKVVVSASGWEVGLSRPWMMLAFSTTQEMSPNADRVR